MYNGVNESWQIEPVGPAVIATQLNKNVTVNIQPMRFFFLHHSNHANMVL